MRQYIEQVIAEHRKCELECYQCSFDLVSQLLYLAGTPHENCICSKAEEQGAGHPKCEALRCPGHPEREKGEIE